MDAVPTVSARQLNRTVLARQLLLQRSRLPLPRVLEAIGGIQAQYAPSMYIGLWSRVDGFERDQLTSALVDRSVVQGTLMRATIHLVSREDYWPFELAVRAPRRTWWVRSQRPGVVVADLEKAGAVVRSELMNGPVPHPELAAKVSPGPMMALHIFCDVVRVPPSGTWARRRANLYASAQDWVGPEPALDPEDALDYAVRRYLSGFGPARTNDIASWAGVPIGEIRAALRRIEIRRYQSEQGEDLVDLADLVLVDAETPAPVRFLPTWDATLHSRPARRCSSRGGPRTNLSRQESAVGSHVPRRWSGRRVLATRRRTRRDRSVPATVQACPLRGRQRSDPPRGIVRRRALALLGGCLASLAAGRFVLGGRAPLL